MDRESQKRIVEALVLGAPEPVSARKIAEVVPGLEPEDAVAIVAELGREYEELGRAFEIWEVAGGYQLRTRPEYASYLRLLHRERRCGCRARTRDLAVVAYRQPVTRAEIEAVRGVEVDAVIRNLLEPARRIAGHREVPGRPCCTPPRSASSRFGLGELDDLPTLREMEAAAAGAGAAVPRRRSVPLDRTRTGRGAETAPERC
jgi:segregation and condensation protein B